MRIHFIAIGGAAMHNLAIALHREGHQLSGSDDRIFDPSRGRLEREGLLPEREGWFPELLDRDIDVVILGMHARPDNSELARAQELNLRIMSYPEFLYEHAKEKTRVVIGGSHGKTSTTAMILHVLADMKMDFDYMVGAQLEGYDCMVRLSDAPLIILEGDEYLSSPIDRRPKFHWYKPQIAILTGVAWDHINVFPTFEGYVEQFRIFKDSMPSDGHLFYFARDEHLQSITENAELHCEAYDTWPHRVEDGTTIIKHDGQEYPLQMFGEHNLQNLSAAHLVCQALGVKTEEFLASIQRFSGAARRSEKIAEHKTGVIYKDFAHSPSKLKATTKAFAEQYPDRHLVACMELHTFSSLNKDFLHEYRDAMTSADTAIVFYDPAVVKQKKLSPFSPADVRAAFNQEDLVVIHDRTALEKHLRGEDWHHKNLLMMSSGTFGGMDLQALAEEISAALD